MTADDGRDGGAGSRARSRRRFLRTGGALLGGAALACGLPLQAGAPAPAALAGRVRGAVVARGAPDYEAWRQSMIWNYRKFRRYPDLIVQAESEDDVVAAVRHAREQGLRITTRSGGHSWSGCFLRDGGILLDVSRLQAIEIDTRTRIAKVQPGVIGRALNARLGEVGLAFPTAHCGMVPVSGFLLGGGLGFNSVAWGGMSVFNIVGVDVVTADGERRHANAQENPDLFWAARGAGPGLFFTVTRFHLQCHPLPRAITTDDYFVPFSQLVPVAEAMAELGPVIDQRVEMLTVVVPAPPDMAKKLGPADRGLIAVMANIAFADTEAEMKSMLAPIAAHPVTKLATHASIGRPTPFEVLYQDNEGPFPQRRARADNIYTDRVGDATRVLAKHMPQAPSPGNSPVILWRGDAPFPEAAYSARGRFYFAGYAQWDAAADDTANAAWLKAMFDEMEPLASGHYINEFDRETRGARTHACYAATNWTRLRDLRRRYDPDGVFQDFIEI